MILSDKFRDFVDGEEIDPEDAFNTTCPICGEWLEFKAEIRYDPIEDRQSIVIEGSSCGEKYRLIPTGYRMEIVSD